MFSGKFEYGDHGSGCYTCQIGRNKLLSAVKVTSLPSPTSPQLDFMKISLFGERVHPPHLKVHVQKLHDCMVGTKGTHLEVLNKI